MKHFNIRKVVSTALALLCCLSFSAATVYADTDGTELQVEQPATLEIQLGSQWAGVEFELKTDTGIFPGTITVGEDGVLRTEIGGSKTYIFSCMNAAASIPSPEDTQAPATTEPSETETPQSEGSEKPTEDSSIDSQEDKDAAVGGIPIQHIILFGGGLLLAVGALVTIHILKKRREETQYRGDDGDENEDE